jgi:hypothetical protein
LKLEDAWVDSNERRWLATAPRDWHQKLLADTAPLLGPAAAEASEAAE